MNLKIHIVQKGDTMWEIAQQYGVDFEELKQLNSQISSPDMIMPGMKIKIPGNSKSVKQKQIKEMQQPPTEQPYKEIQKKPTPVIKEDDKEKPKMVKPEMPEMPPMPSMPPMPPMQQMYTQPMMQMPVMEQEFQNYTTINFPHMTAQPKQEVKPVKKEKPKEEPKQVKAQQQPMPQPMPMMQPQVPMAPLCCYVMDPCYPQIPFQTVGPNPWACHGMAMPSMPMPYEHGQHASMMGMGSQGYMPTMGNEMMPQMQANMGGGAQSAWNNQMQYESQGMYRGQAGEENPDQHTSDVHVPLYPPFQNNMNQMPFPMPPGYYELSQKEQREKKEDK
ncbi:morphogenetic protein associated with SpoVID [Virgibacillus chiguensis]|uniref:Morphogenetic protein associated with SpoVID n=1 Tax=Virgibacillus chiguensis TaxID=411959 RepID=A0A1M5M8F3_9BACI|nr:morphogenetic protein associated with SpoVID [Virgibacillus chiguensis]